MINRQTKNNPALSAGLRGSTQKNLPFRLAATTNFALSGLLTFLGGRFFSFHNVKKLVANDERQSSTFKKFPDRRLCINYPAKKN